MGIPVYIIETDHGHLGTQLTGYREDTRSSAIEGVAGSISTPVVRVLEIIEDENSCRDVTEDFAREIRDKVESGEIEECPWELAEWIHKQLGVHSLKWPRRQA